MGQYHEFVKELRDDSYALKLMKWYGEAELVSKAADIIEELDYKYQKALIDIAKKSNKEKAPE